MIFTWAILINYVFGIKRHLFVDDGIWNIKCEIELKGGMLIYQIFPYFLLMHKKPRMKGHVKFIKHT